MIQQLTDVLKIDKLLQSNQLTDLIYLKKLGLVKFLNQFYI